MGHTDQGGIIGICEPTLQCNEKRSFLIIPQQSGAQYLKNVTVFVKAAYFGLEIHLISLFKNE